MKISTCLNCTETPLGNGESIPTNSDISYIQLVVYNKYQCLCITD